MPRKFKQPKSKPVPMFEGECTPSTQRPPYQNLPDPVDPVVDIQQFFSTPKPREAALPLLSTSNSCPDVNWISEPASGNWIHPATPEAFDTTRISSSSSTCTTIDPEQDVPTPQCNTSYPFSVMDDKNVDKVDKWETISTLSPLLREAFGGEMIKYKGIYSLVGSPQPVVWQHLRTCLADVKTFCINRDTNDDGALISPAILLKIQMELGKLPFFPNLQALHIHSIGPLVYFSPLFILPSLKAITTVRWNKSTKGKKEDGEAFENFLKILPDKAPELESLIIDHPDKVFTFASGVFKDFFRFRSIRTLHFHCPVMFGGIDDIKSFSVLPHLEELRMAISWCGWIEATPSQKASTSITMDNVKRLILSAPPHIFLEVIRTIEVKKLDCIIGECSSTTFWDMCNMRAREIWEVMMKKWPEARMALATFLLSEENDCPSFSDAFKPMLTSTLDLKSILLGPSQANLIFIADPKATVALSDLGGIADELPALVSLSLAIDTSDVPDCDVKPMRHKLEQLMVYGVDPVEKNKLFDIARFLHCLFPNLQAVQVTGGSGDWKEISKLVQFSHQIAQDELKRTPWLPMAGLRLGS